eukprot:15475699-Alexandrium_andersonii.AAC.1
MQAASGIAPRKAGELLPALRSARNGSESVDGTGVAGRASPSKGSRQQGSGPSSGGAETGSGCLPPTASRGMALRIPP